MHAARAGAQIDVLVVVTERGDRVEDFTQVVVTFAADGVCRGLQDGFGPLVFEAGGGVNIILSTDTATEIRSACAARTSASYWEWAAATGSASSA